MYTYSDIYFNKNCYSSPRSNSTVKSKNAEPVDSVPKPVQVRHKFSKVMTEIPFNPSFKASNFRTQLVSNDEKNKYNELQKSLDRHTKKELENLLKKGVLLNQESGDNSSVLDNLHKIITTPRFQGLNSVSLAKDLISTLNNPYLITQQFGDIPTNSQNMAIDVHMADNNLNKTDTNARKNALKDINVTQSGTCVAASIEFSLAKNNPAEFARFAEGLTSPQNKVEKTIHLNKLADNTLDAIWLLNAFEVPFEADDFNKAVLTFKPDKNAYIRAQIQTVDKDPGERTPIDVLMQSTFMQLGSQQSYDTLTDKRKGKFNQNNKGLIEFEKTFTESVVEDKNKISVTYQTVDDNARLVGYETDQETLKRHLTSALDKGENVILGYTQTDSNNIIINGHEITVIGYKKEPSGKLKFICNDTDDDLSKPIEYSEDYILPKIHHAALPQDIVQNDVQMVENWKEGIATYKELKMQHNKVQKPEQYNAAA